MPGPVSMGGVAGREWEKMIENNVMHFERHADEALSSGEGRAIEVDAEGMLDIVARSLGSKHWTAVRLASILHGARRQIDCT